MRSIVLTLLLTGAQQLANALPTANTASVHVKRSESNYVAVEELNHFFSNDTVTRAGGDDDACQNCGNFYTSCGIGCVTASTPITWATLYMCQAMCFTQMCVTDMRPLCLDKCQYSLCVNPPPGPPAGLGGTPPAGVPNPAGGAALKTVTVTQV